MMRTTRDGEREAKILLRLVSGLSLFKGTFFVFCFFFVCWAGGRIFEELRFVLFVGRILRLLEVTRMMGEVDSSNA